MSESWKRQKRAQRTIETKDTNRKKCNASLRMIQRKSRNFEAPTGIGSGEVSRWDRFKKSIWSWSQREQQKKNSWQSLCSRTYQHKGSCSFSVFWPCWLRWWCRGRRSIFMQDKTPSLFIPSLRSPSHCPLHSHPPRNADLHHGSEKAMTVFQQEVDLIGEQGMKTGFLKMRMIKTCKETQRKKRKKRKERRRPKECER